MIKDLLEKLLLKFVIKNAPLRGRINEEQYIIAMSKMWQNPAVTQYLDEREVYLIYEGMNKFCDGNLEDAKGLAGQLLEVRALRTRMRVCYTSLHKEKVSTPSPRRRHSR